MTMLRVLPLAACLVAAATQALAQAEPEATAHAEAGHETHHGLAGTHRLTAGLGHTHVSRGKDLGGDRQWLVLASSSLDYDYWLSDKWAVGLQNELVLEQFVIEDNAGEEVERNHPLLIVPVAIYKPFEHFSFMGGIGIEYTSDETLTATRLGVEYGTHLGPRWEVGAAVVWDAKWNYYDSWGLSFTVSRLFGGRH
jgi:hypothetical protein